MKKVYRSLSNILAEAILISLIMAWMSILASLPGTIDKTSASFPPVIEPVYCNDNMIILKVIEPGIIENISNYTIYCIYPNETTVNTGECILPLKNEVVIINSTEILPDKLVFLTGSTYLIIDRETCTIKLTG